MARLRLIGFAAILMSGFCFAQSDNSPHFEVASARPASGFGAFSGGLSNGHVTYAGTTLKILINEAYDLGPGQLSGPDWLGTEYYAVSAKFPADTTRGQYRQMLANFLIERFSVVLHRSTRDVTGYEMTVVPGATKLTPSNPEANGDSASARMAGELVDGMMRITFRRATMILLANRLGSVLSVDDVVPVTDGTGLSGEYDFELTFPYSAAQFTAEGQRRRGQSGATTGDPDVGPKEISAALEQQLGLKLNLVKSRLDFIVVDHANKVPTDN